MGLIEKMQVFFASDPGLVGPVIAEKEYVWDPNSGTLQSLLNSLDGDFTVSSRSVVTIKSGTHSAVELGAVAGDITLPPNVSLRGEGYCLLTAGLTIAPVSATAITSLQAIQNIEFYGNLDVTLANCANNTTMSMLFENVRFTQAGFNVTGSVADSKIVSIVATTSSFIMATVASDCEAAALRFFDCVITGSGAVEPTFTQCITEWNNCKFYTSSTCWGIKPAATDGVTYTHYFRGCDWEAPGLAPNVGAATMPWDPLHTPAGDVSYNDTEARIFIDRFNASYPPTIADLILAAPVYNCLISGSIVQVRNGSTWVRNHAVNYASSRVAGPWTCTSGPSSSNVAQLNNDFTFITGSPPGGALYHWDSGANATTIAYLNEASIFGGVMSLTGPAAVGAGSGYISLAASDAAVNSPFAFDGLETGISLAIRPAAAGATLNADTLIYAGVIIIGADAGAADLPATAKHLAVQFDTSAGTNYINAAINVDGITQTILGLSDTYVAGVVGDRLNWTKDTFYQFHFDFSNLEDVHIYMRKFPNTDWTRLHIYTLGGNVHTYVPLDVSTLSTSAVTPFVRLGTGTNIEDAALIDYMIAYEPRA